MDLHEPIEILSLSDPFKAAVIRDALEAEGIRSFLEGYNQAALPGINAVPIRVFVEAADAESARELIAQHEMLDLTTRKNRGAPCGRECQGSGAWPIGHSLGDLKLKSPARLWSPSCKISRLNWRARVTGVRPHFLPVNGVGRSIRFDFHRSAVFTLRAST